MAQPGTAAVIFETIREQTEDFVNAQITEAQQKFPHLQDLTVRKYHAHHFRKFSEWWIQEKAQPLHTAKQLFKTAYNWDPMGPTGGKDLHQLLGSDHFENITLGQLRGQSRLDLIPATSILPSSKVPENCTQFDLAYTNGGAISYPDGHPSEADHHQITISAPKDGKLRRFMSLGWVIKVDSSDAKNWKRTGHVLVIDIDEGRDRHPWFVLASEWPDDSEFRPDMTVYAEKRVSWNDRNAHGVLPEDNNRTPIARLRPNPAKPVAGPMLLQFGPEFEFDVTRLGGREKGGVRTGHGPDLANIMHWYEDKERDEEVCYSPDGKEYMRYNRSTKLYRYPRVDFEAWRQQVGLAGPSPDPVSLESRMGTAAFTEGQRRQRESQASTSHP